MLKMMNLLPFFFFLIGGVWICGFQADLELSDPGMRHHRPALILKLGGVAQGYIPSTRNDEAERSQGWGWSWLQSETLSQK